MDESAPLPVVDRDDVLVLSVYPLTYPLRARPCQLGVGMIWVEGFGYL